MVTKDTNINNSKYSKTKYKINQYSDITIAIFNFLNYIFEHQQANAANSSKGNLNYNFGQLYAILGNFFSVYHQSRAGAPRAGLH